MIDVTTNLDSEFIERTEDGGVWVRLGAPQAFELQTGHIVEPDGTMTDPDGTKYRPVMRGEEFVGFQYFRPDGTPAVPGEVLTLPNGQTVEQMVVD